MNTEKRHEQLLELEMVLIGSEYRGKKDLNRDFNVHFVEINCDPDEVWNAKINKMKTELEKRKKVSRPVTSHKHTEGEWKKKEFGSGRTVIYVEKGSKTLLFAAVEPIKNSEEAIANAKLISIAPQLLQIAEMFFDTMKGTDAEGSLPFNITLETLNRLK